MDPRRIIEICSSFVLRPNWQSFSHYIFIREHEHKHLFNWAHLYVQAFVTNNLHAPNLCHQLCDTQWHFMLTCPGLLLRIDKYEPHIFRQFGIEQSIVISVLISLPYPTTLAINTVNLYDFVGYINS